MPKLQEEPLGVAGTYCPGKGDDELNLNQPLEMTNDRNLYGDYYMANYICVHRQSNLIKGVIASSGAPANTEEIFFVRVSDVQLEKYYRLKSKLPLDGCVDIGDLLNVCPALFEKYSSGKSWESHRRGAISRRMANEPPSHRRRRRAAAKRKEEETS